MASAAGFPLTDAEFAANCELVTQEGSPYVPSMYRDLFSGKPTEVEHIFGDLLARADKLTVDAPRLALATANVRVHQNRIAHASER